MSEPTRDASGVPLGEPPEAVRRQREQTRALLADVQVKAVRTRTPKRPAAPVVTESAANADDEPAVEVAVPAVPAVPTRPTTKTPRKAITLEHTLITFELEIVDFSVTGRFLTVVFDKTVKMPDPTEPTKFKLHISGRTYPVEHMGINFEIPSMNLRGVSFLLIEDSK